MLTITAHLQIISSVIAAIFAYLGWVRMAQTSAGKIQREFNARMDSPSDLDKAEPALYPQGATVMEADGKKYKILKNILPFYDLKGHISINLRVIDSEKVKLHNLRKEAFGSTSAYIGCTVDDYENPTSITVVFGSLDAQKVFKEFTHVTKLLTGKIDIRVPVSDDQSDDEIEQKLENAWDANEQAPPKDIPGL